MFEILKELFGRHCCQGGCGCCCGCCCCGCCCEGRVCWIGVGVAAAAVVVVAVDRQNFWKYFAVVVVVVAAVAAAVVGSGELGWCCYWQRTEAESSPVAGTGVAAVAVVCRYAVVDAVVVVVHGEAGDHWLVGVAQAGTPRIRYVWKY